MNRTAVTEMIRVLEKVPEEKFDLRTWRRSGLMDMVREGRCGSAACAVGWAAQDPWFQAHGFKLVRGKNTGRLTPVYQDLIGWGAVSEFFDVTRNMAEYLFTPSAYPGFNATRDQVIFRLMRVLEWESLKTDAGEGDERPRRKLLASPTQPA